MITYTTTDQIYNDLKIVFNQMSTHNITSEKIDEFETTLDAIFNLQPDVDLYLSVNTNSSFNVPIILVHQPQASTLLITFVVKCKEDLTEAVETILNLYLPQQIQDNVVLNDKDATIATNNIIKSLTHL